jgi:hypothetical protein
VEKALEVLHEHLGEAGITGYLDLCTLEPTERPLDELISLVKETIQENEQEKRQDMLDLEEALWQLLRVIGGDEMQLFLGCFRDRIDFRRFVGICPISNMRSEAERTLDEFKQSYGFEAMGIVAKIAFHAIILQSPPKDVREVNQILSPCVESRQRRDPEQNIPYALFQTHMESEFEKVCLLR